MTSPMRLSLLALTISLASVMPAAGEILLDSARSSIDAQGWADAASPVPFSFSNSSASPVLGPYSAAVMGSQTQIANIDSQNLLVGGQVLTSQSGNLDPAAGQFQENQSSIAADATLADGMHVSGHTFFEMFFTLTEPHDYSLWADLNSDAQTGQTATLELDRQGGSPTPSLCLVIWKRPSTAVSRPARTTSGPKARPSSTTPAPRFTRPTAR